MATTKRCGWLEPPIGARYCNRPADEPHVRHHYVNFPDPRPTVAAGTCPTHGRFAVYPGDTGACPLCVDFTTD